MSEKIKQYATEVKGEGDRLMVLRLVYGDCPINIVSVYAPQTGSPDEVKEEFWEDVERVIEGFATEERVIVGANFNVHTDGQMQKDEGCLTLLGLLILQLQKLYFVTERSTSHTRVEEIRLK